MFFVAYYKYNKLLLLNDRKQELKDIVKELVFLVNNTFLGADVKGITSAIYMLILLNNVLKLFGNNFLIGYRYTELRVLCYNIFEVYYYKQEAI